MKQAVLVNELQRRTKVPLFIGMDLEWGLAMRLILRSVFHTK